MNRIFSSSINNHQDITRYLSVILFSIVIAYFFPRVKSFKYDFEKGKPWRYESLIASFNYGIYKSKSEVDFEKKQKLKDYIPYYKIDYSVKKNVVEKFVVDFNSKYLNQKNELRAEKIDSTTMLGAGISIIDNLYFKGIIYLQEGDTAASEINVFESENEVRRSKPTDFLTIKEAYLLGEKQLNNLPNTLQVFLKPLLEDAIEYNVLYNDTLNKTFSEEMLAEISLTRGKVQEGEMIINKGAIVTPEKFSMLESYRIEYEKRIAGEKKSFATYLGNFFIALIILFVFIRFLKIFSTEVYQSNRKTLFLLFLIAFMLIAESIVVNSNFPILYAIPFCIVPIICRTFFGVQTALHTYLILMLLSSFIIPHGTDFLVINILAGMVALFSSIRANYWTQFFLLNAALLVTYFSTYSAILLSHEGSLRDIDLDNYGWLALNIIFVLLSYPLIPFFEKLFGFVSEITLLELSDINKPLLKELSIKAPGTFQHSLQVANLAEAAAYEIGANTLLVKTGALYHDIGKTLNASYFVENQATGVNPHDELTFEESAHVIISHVSEGITLAKMHKLPDIIIDFIRTHHGTSRVEYFYQSYLKNYPEKEIDDAAFSYPGPLPYNKETAIVMMADTVEAAARSIKIPTAENLDELVDVLINYKIDQQQFINCNITFKEISTIKKTLKKMLRSMYHARIDYVVK